MLTSDAVRERPRAGTALERRAGEESAAWLRALRRFRGLLRRPLAVERRGLQLHLVLVERRHNDGSDPRPSAAEVRSDLRERLRAQGRDHARQFLRHLMVVYRELGREGWRGVGALPADVLGKALSQAELLAGEKPSRQMSYLVDRLYVLKTTVEKRDLNRRLLRHGVEVEISEATQEDFEQIERSWFGSLPGQPSEPPAPR